MYRDLVELATFPSLVCAPDDPAQLVPGAGVVILLHGLGSEKEDLLDEVERLGRAGLIAIAIDAVGHGQRRSDELEELILGSPEEEERAFYQVIRQTALELPALLDALTARAWSTSGRVALLGIGMGAFIALRARTLDPRVEVMITISGSPEWTRHTGESPARQLEAFWPAALLLVHGEQDDVVAPGGGLDFVERLRPLYQDDPDRLRRVTFPGVGHIFPPATWERVMEQGERFIRRYLPEAATSIH